MNTIFQLPSVAFLPADTPNKFVFLKYDGYDLWQSTLSDIPRHSKTIVSLNLLRARLMIQQATTNITLLKIRRETILFC